MNVLTFSSALLVIVLQVHLGSPMVTVGMDNLCLNDVGECSGVGMGQMQYPSCTDCAKFYKCDPPNGTEYMCGGALHYDVTLGVCNFASFAVCGTTVTSTTSQTSSTSSTSPTSPTSPTPAQGRCLQDASTCGSMTEELGLYPVCGDCYKFVHCHGTLGAVKDCPASLHFNPALRVCDWPEHAGCTQQQIAK